MLSAVGIECLLPNNLLSELYGNSSTSANSAAVVSYPTQTVTFKLLVANATGEPAVLETRTYPVAKCELNADCMHDGVCWQGSCQCAFGYSGAFCNQAATNVAGLQTMVRCACCA